jgi:hypothetical protein
MSFRLLRKIPGLDGIVKDLAEKLQRAQADQGVEDVTLFRQNRVDYDEISLIDAGSQTLNGDRADADAILYTDSQTMLLQEGGQFTIALDGDGSDQAQPVVVDFWTVG